MNETNCANKLPSYNEIDKKANEEASGLGKDEGAYVDGFIAGALYIKKVLKDKLGSLF